MTSRYVNAKIKKFEKRFNQLKREIRNSLRQSNIPIEKIADTLSDMPADDVPEHKQFQDACLHLLYRADDHNELFGTLNPYVNYLSYHLLDYLVDEFDLKAIKDEMETYKKDLKRFREKTPLKLFCGTQTKRYIKLSSDFREVVAIFKWPDDVTLEVVEQFRREYACHYSLRECAMMLAQARPCSFIITWYIPESVVEKLKANIPKEILKKYSATQLDIDGSCVFRLHKRKVCPHYVVDTRYLHLLVLYFYDRWTLHPDLSSVSQLFWAHLMKGMHNHSLCMLYVCHTSTQISTLTCNSIAIKEDEVCQGTCSS